MNAREAVSHIVTSDMTALEKVLAIALLAEIVTNDDFDARNVAQHKNGDLSISTVEIPKFVHNSERTIYQTAVESPEYPSATGWIVVGEYETREAAQTGHDAWVERFRTGMPDELRNVDSFRTEHCPLVVQRAIRDDAA